MKLKRFYFDKENLQNDKIIISGQDVKHIKNVMRLNVGDSLIACCGDGFDYICKIDAIAVDIICSIVNREKNIADARIDVTLFQALLKSDKLELITQKITELGIANLALFESEFCVVKAKENSNKIDRLNKIAIESTKQCGRSIPLNIFGAISFESMLKKLAQFDCVIFAYEGDSIERISEIEGDFNNIAIIIGSEGGFSQKEKDELIKLENVHCITLGSRILRAETASIATSAIVMEHFER